MGLGLKWKEAEAITATNSTNLAAGSIEFEITGPKNVDFFNRLQVVNLDTVNIVVYLDGDVSSAGKQLPVQSNGGIQGIEPSDGIFFRTVSQKNLDGSTAETSGKIYFRAAKAIDVSTINFEEIKKGANKFFGGSF